MGVLRREFWTEWEEVRKEWELHSKTAVTSIAMPNHENLEMERLQSTPRDLLIRPMVTHRGHDVVQYYTAWSNNEVIRLGCGLECHKRYRELEWIRKYRALHGRIIEQRDNGTAFDNLIIDI